MRRVSNLELMQSVLSLSYIFKWVKFFSNSPDTSSEKTMLFEAERTDFINGIFFSAIRGEGSCSVEQNYAYRCILPIHCHVELNSLAAA